MGEALWPGRCESRSSVRRMCTVREESSVASAVTLSGVDSTSSSGEPNAGGGSEISEGSGEGC